MSKSNLQRTVELSARALRLVQRIIAVDAKVKSRKFAAMQNNFRTDLVGLSEEEKRKALEGKHV